MTKQPKYKLSFDELTEIIQEFTIGDVVNVRCDEGGVGYDIVPDKDKYLEEQRQALSTLKQELLKGQDAE